ncbi:MAG: deoxynucleoside kinase [Chloroflexi bacterium]|nr:deoxynucleoside kinase [Chloroflexota bacterium]
MYIAIEGVIGVGKTTLARLLQPVFQAEVLLEVFEENPFLSDFYADRQRYAFQTQIFFLLSRYHQQRQAVPDVLSRKNALLADYTFEKDALFARINLVGDELDMYDRVHDALAEKIPVPDLIVYLRAETETLMQRIAMRDRPYERNMEYAYIDQLNQAYESFFAGPRQAGRRGAAVLVVDTNHLDFVRRAEDLDWVEQRIRQALRLSPFQAELPFSAPAEA